METAPYSVEGPINIQDVNEKAPQKIGLYVWYAHFHAEKADWNSSNAEGEMHAKNNFSKALINHSAKFNKQKMAVNILANFSTEWKGDLEESPNSRWGNILLNDCNYKQSNLFWKSIQSDNAREAYIDLLKYSFPFFHAPLYMGIAIRQFLVDRLNFHKNKFIKLYHSKNVNLSNFKNGKDFSERAISFGFCPEDLFCYTISPTNYLEENISQNQIVNLIESAEWILNRWSTPILGRD